MTVQINDLDQFLQKYPLLYRKLCFWAGKRGEKDAGAQVREYLSELVVDVSENNDHTVLLEKWNPILSPQERIELINRSPIPLGDFRNGEHWYDFQKGEYSVVSEEILHEIRWNDQTEGAITRNRYYCWILNCPRMMIIDVDIQAPENDEIQDCPASCRSAISEEQAIAAVKSLTEESPQLGFRSYRTRNGLRHICTTRFFDPLDTATHQLMKALCVDPLYARLCKFQATFRARLTPKPWRLDEDYIENRFFYDRTTGLLLPEASPYAVVHLLTVIGNPEILPQFERLIQIHDACCGHDRLEFKLA